MTGPPRELVTSNAVEVEAWLARIAERAAFPEPALVLASRELEAHEESVFAAYGGKYVLTGALKASLTGSASGAVRRLVPGGLEFGSSVPYAEFQGTEGVGDHAGPSAVLKVGETERAGIGATVLEYIVHGHHLL